MVKVKICGITNPTDALRAASAGADALGFIFVRGTPRYVRPELVKPIVLSLPPLVVTVGVFVDADPEKVIEIVDFCRLDYAQLHGHESPKVCQRMQGRKLIKAFRIRTEDDVRELDHYRVDAYLLDTSVPGLPGGTGESFDWHIARAAGVSGKPIILAGGLNPDNVAEAIHAGRPMAVDVGSGVEARPGKKDKGLLEAFIRNAKSVKL